MDFATFVAATVAQPPEGHRRGQYVFNLLYAVRPDLGNRVRATDIDPYYDDDALASLMEWLSVNWGDVGTISPVLEWAARMDDDATGVDAVQG